MIRHLAAALVGLLAVAALAQPITIEGVKFEPRATVGDQTLVLNGAGLRTRAFFKVYAAGLYVQQKSGDAATLLAQTGALRMSIGMLRDVEGTTFAGSLLDGLKSNKYLQCLDQEEASVGTLESLSVFAISILGHVVLWTV